MEREKRGWWEVSKARKYAKAAATPPKSLSFWDSNAAEEAIMIFFEEAAHSHLGHKMMEMRPVDYDFFAPLAAQILLPWKSPLSIVYKTSPSSCKGQKTTRSWIKADQQQSDEPDKKAGDGSDRWWKAKKQSGKNSHNPIPGLPRLSKKFSRHLRARLLMWRTKNRLKRHHRVWTALLHMHYQVLAC